MVILSVSDDQRQLMTLTKHLTTGHSICELEISVLFKRKTMDRYEQRRRKLLQNPEVMAGYREMSAEMDLMRLLDEVRKQQNLTQEELAERIGRKREAISRLFSADDVNPTIGTLIELLAALDLTADITLRHTREGEGPMKVVLESSAPYDV